MLDMISVVNKPLMTSDFVTINLNVYTFLAVVKINFSLIPRIRGVVRIPTIPSINLTLIYGANTIAMLNFRQVF